MIGFVSYTTLALSAAASVSALVVPRMPQKPAPPGWATNYLEPYATYHARYIALDCQDQHGTQFFDDCCHPLLATETLATARPPQCIPSPDAVSSAAGAEATVTDSSQSDYDDGDDSSDDSGDDSGNDNEPAPPTPPPATLNTDSAPSDNGDNKPHGGQNNGGQSQGDGQPQSDSAPSDPAPQSDSQDGGAPQGGGKGNSNNNNNNNNNDSNSNPPSGGGGSGSSSGGGGGDVITDGVATFYQQGGVAGACGDFHSDSDFVCALQTELYGDINAVSPNCGRTIHITNPANGKSVDVVVVDACPTCENGDSIDLSPAAFDQIADPDQGVVPISWSFTS